MDKFCKCIQSKLLTLILWEEREKGAGKMLSKEAFTLLCIYFHNI